MTVSVQTRDKNCNTCHVVKPLTDYYRKTQSSDGHQGQCKQCSKMRQRDWINSIAPSRQTDGEVELTAEQRISSYTDVIYRMLKLGIMSKETALESLERVTS